MLPEKIQKAERAGEIVKSNQIHKDYRRQWNEGRHAEAEGQGDGNKKAVGGTQRHCNDRKAAEKDCDVGDEERVDKWVVG